MSETSIPFRLRNLPEDCASIETGCIEYCHYCGAPLALIEPVQADGEQSLGDACRRDVESLHLNIGLALKVPVFRIVYVAGPGEAEISSAAIREVGKTAVDVVTGDELAQFIDSIHDCPWCRKRQDGRFARVGPSHLTQTGAKGTVQNAF
jgi:hypothetical protein